MSGLITTIKLRHFKGIFVSPGFYVILILIVHALLSYDTIWRLSPAYDEASKLMSGYTFLKNGDLKGEGALTPPFAVAWAAIPLLFIHPDLPTQNHSWNDLDARIGNRY